jgi:outer membrane biosynthesis protein TonB
MSTSAGEFGHWSSSIARSGGGPGRGALIGSLLLHVSVIAAVWLAGLQTRSDLPPFVQYRVKLYSPPPTVQGPPTPVEQTTAPVVAPPRPELPTAEPKTTPKTQAAVPKPVESKPTAAKPATGENPKPGPVGGENINITMEGQEFPYPEYLVNIQLALHRYFRWNGAPNLSAAVVFYINRDGSAGGIDVKRSSGNFRFDLQVHEAVEQAGRARAFGALPADWQGDRLWIENTFAPGR